MLLDNFWDTKSLCKLRRYFFPVIVLRVYKHFFNISETWLLDELIFPEMMWSLAKQKFSSYTQFEGRLPLEWSEVFTCSKKLGESITHSQGRNISPLLCSWAGMWSHWGSASLQQSCPLHRASPLHLWRLNSCPRLWGPDFLEGQWGTQKVWKEICFTARQSGRCGLDTDYLSSHNLYT